MIGFGDGSHFVAHLGMSCCNHCANTTRQQLYADYSSTALLGMADFTYAGIKVICPVCHHGSGYRFAPLNSRFDKVFGGGNAKRKRAEVIASLKALASEADIPSTRSYYHGLSWLDKRRYRGMLEQLELNDLMVLIQHG